MKENNWISIKDQLPEIDIAVLTYQENNKYPQFQYLVLGYSEDSEWREFCDHEGDDRLYEPGEFLNVTHWKSLSPPIN